MKLLLKEATLVAGFDDVAVVSEPIQQGSSQLGVAKHARPFGEAQVGGDHHTGVLVELGQQVKQQRPAGLAERQIAQFIENHQIHAQQGSGDAPGLAVVLLALQQVDQVDRGVETHTLAVQGDAGYGQRSGQVGLTGARATDEHHILRAVSEVQAGQIPDQAGISAGRSEVETRQIAVHI